ncbi:MAG: HlyD family efflux transporter periplasmic adaptor subunit [Planctomycetaceae bacterium]
MIQRAIGFVIVAAVLIGSLWYSQLHPGPRTVSGFIEADEIRLGSRVGGRIHNVLVDEGQSVAAGDVLVELEPFDLLQRRAQAEAVLKQQQTAHEKLTSGYRPEEIAQAKARDEQSRANLLMLQNGPREQELETARAELNLVIAELDLAEENYGRTANLQKQGAATQEALDRARKERQAATERVTARREQLELLEEGTREEEIAIAEARVREANEAWQLMQNGYREEEIAEAAAAVQAAQSALDAIDTQIEELKVQSPTAGVVDALDLQPGDLVSANAPVVSLVDMTNLWVRAYVPENELDISIGQKLKVTVDSYPSDSFTGEITFIARQAEFTPGNVQTPEERSKQVFRIKVTLLDGHDRLRPGMSADVWLEGTP